MKEKLLELKCNKLLGSLTKKRRAFAHPNKPPTTIGSYSFISVPIDLDRPFWPTSKVEVGQHYAYRCLRRFQQVYFFKPTRDGSGGLVTKFLKEEIFLKFGVPEILVFDNARAFMERQLVELLKKYGISHWTNAFYHP